MQHCQDTTQYLANAHLGMHSKLVPGNMMDLDVFLLQGNSASEDAKTDDCRYA